MITLPIASAVIIAIVWTIAVFGVTYYLVRRKD